MFRATSSLAYRGLYRFSNRVNYFNLFNLPPTFTEQQLKSSYLQLVKKYHPDLTTEPNAAQFFRHIQEGYEVLSDPAKRREHQSSHSASTIEPENKDIYDQMVEKYFKTYQRKDLVNDEFNFSYKLFKEHYEKVQAPKVNYQRYEGQGGDQYYAHKQEKPQKIWKPIAGISVMVAAIGLGYFYTNM